MESIGGSQRALGQYQAPPTWVRLSLGVVLIVAGLFVIADVVTATLLSAIFIAAMLFVAGLFEIGHAFWTKGWGNFVWKLLLGVLYVAFGLMLLRQPLAGALIFTWVLGVLFFASGLSRIFMTVRHWRDSGWLMLLSGIFGVLAGLGIFAGWPASGLVVLGYLLGIDLIFHGCAWLTYSSMPTLRTAAMPETS